ncbi:MAG: Hsp20/alpha crystallin family protein [Dehalococcoidia bacterium]
MVMARWDPFREMRRMQQMTDRLWRSSSAEGEAMEIGAWTMPLDIVENNDSIVVRAAVPGIDPQEIDVSVEDNILTISAERRSESEQQEGRYLLQESAEGSFRRSVRLPNIIDGEQAESSCENGVLSITFPKQEQKKARRIEVKSGGQQQLESTEQPHQQAA